MRKLLSILMMVVMLNPLTAKAGINPQIVKPMATNEAVELEQEGIADFYDDFSDGDYDDFKYVKETKPFLITFRPTSMSGRAYYGSVKFKGNFTKACVRTVIQVSRYKNFSGAQTHTFPNPEFKGNVYAQLIYEMNWDEKRICTVNKRRILKQNSTSLCYRRQNNFDGGYWLPLTPSVIDEARKKVCSNPKRTLTISGIRNGEKLYYRARNIYEYDGDKYYSPWTEVKVTR